MPAKVRGASGGVNWRRLAIRLHLWGGLLTGPFLLVLGLSGAALVFRTEIESLESATPAVASSGPGAPSLDAVVGIARTRHPTAEPYALRIPSAPGQPYRVELRAGRQHLEIAVDPSTLQIVGGRAAERSVMVAVRSLHAGLHAGRLGAVVVGLLGLWLVVESLTGLWLCWPSVRRRPRVAGGAPIERVGSRGLHRLVGGASLALGVVITLTGVVLALGSVLAPAGASPSPARTVSGLSRLDVIAARAAASLPGAKITALIARDSDAVRVETTAGAVIVDRETGHVARAPSSETRLGVCDWIARLHYGDFAGWVSRVAYALVGLGLCLLSITGYLITAQRTSGPS